MGRPVKIVELITPQSASNTPPEIIFYEEELKSILDQLDCPVEVKFSITSVTGPSHDGKSFLLSTLLTCFRNHGGVNIEAVLPELDSTHKNFEWNCMGDTDTSGIFLWSEPCISKASRPGEEPVVNFLMCIQEGKNITEDGRINLIRLSTLISSRLYGNIIPELPVIPTNVLKLLGPYKNYDFIIKLADEVLEEFEDQICLINPIWIQVSDTDKKETHTHLTLLETMSSCFKKSSENVIFDIKLCGGLLETPAKDIFGIRPCISKLNEFFKSFASLLNTSCGKLSFDDIQKCSFELILSDTVDFVLSIYDADMEGCIKDQKFLADASLIKLHQDVLKLSKHLYKSELEFRKLFNVSGKALIAIMDEYSRQLEYKLYLKFQTLWAINESQREQWVKSLRDELVETFRNPRVPRFRDKEAFHDEVQLERICSREMNSKVSSFRLKVAEYLEADEMKQEIAHTENALKKELELLLEENKRRQDEAERKTLEMLNRNVLQLAKNIGSKSALEFVTQKMLQTTEEPNTKEAINQGLSCAICYEEKVSIAYACGHVIGEKCHQMLQQKSQQNRNGFLCHQCRKPVNSTIKLYF